MGPQRGTDRLGSRAGGHLLALEPRMMFDAAAVATTQAVLAHADAAAHDPAPHHDAALDAFAPDARTAAAPGADATPAREIVFIDTAVADYRQLADEWASRGEVVLIDSGRDGVEQVRAALTGRADLAAIHIVGHGEAGRMAIGTARLDAASIDGAFADSLRQIGATLATGGDILLYGCDFASGAEGARAVERLAAVTHADIAASTDRTGAAALGGDWDLERATGTIEARTLAALDWAHTLDPNAAVPISVTADSLTVTFNGATLVSNTTGATGYDAQNRTADVGVGAVARWTGAATLADGTLVDLKATVVTLTAGDAVRFNRPGIGTNGDDPTFLLRDISTNSTTANDGAQVQLRWELVRTGTDVTLPANVQFNILDIDGVGGNPNTRETVSTSTQNLAYYTRARASDIFFTTSLDSVSASGTQDENTGTAPISQQSAATFDWSAVSSFTLTYQLGARNGVTNLAQFYHDGDADFIYTDPVYVSIPRLDLDGDNSTAPGNDARFTFREGDPAVPVVDTDVVVSNPMGPNSIIRGTVALTNAQAGDALVVGTLPANITATVTQGAGTITVALSGAGSEADYAAAFRAIGFRNTSDTPDQTQRVINVSFANDTLTSALAVSRIDVVPVNDAPVTQPDAAATAEDTPVTIPVLANDSDPDGDALTIIGATAPNGSVVLNPDGTITYTPRADYNGTDTITYTVSDGNGGTATGTVAVTVTPVNDAPVPVGTLPAQRAADRDTVSYPTAAGFADVDNDTLTYSAAGLPAGLAIDAATGVVSGTLDRSASQANGGAYTITVTATDPSGATATQSFTLTVTNPAPTAADDTATTAEDTPVTIDVRANDTDPDGDPLTVTGAVADSGAVTLNGNGTITYTPNANFNGTDTIRYTISDGQGGTANAVVTVTVTAVNDPPRAAVALPRQAGSDAAAVSFATAYGFTDPDGDPLAYSAAGLPAGLVIDAATGIVSGTLGRSASQVNGGNYTVTITATDPSGRTAQQSFTFIAGNPAPIARTDAVTLAEDTSATIAVLANDTDPDGDPLAIIAATAANGNVVINADNTITYTPNADFSGPETITYTISDGEGGTATSTVAVTVTPVNDAPRTAAPLPPRAARDAAAVSVATAGGFTDPDGDTLTYAATGLPAGLAIDAATGVIAGTLDRSASQANGGLYTITVTATDPSGASASQGFTFTVTNPAPIAADDSATTPENVAITIPVLANDSDSDGDPLTVIAATAGIGGVVVNPDNTLTYTPARGFTGTETIVYTISDGQGGTASATVTVTVGDVPPVARPIADQAVADAQGVTLAARDAFSDANGDTLRFTATGLPPGLAIDPATGVISGTIDRSASQAGGGVYASIVTADDGNGGTASTTIRWTVANPAPIARDDTATTRPGTAVTIPVLANDSDPDGDPLTVTAAGATRGTVIINPDNSLTYTPEAGFAGTDTITYTISDGEGGTATAIVTVGVDNAAPVARPDTATTRPGTPVTIPVLANDSDADGDPLTVTAATAGRGAVAINPDGTLTYTPAPGFTGTDTITYTINDGRGGTATTTVSVGVVAENRAPVAQPFADQAARDGQTVALATAGAFADPDGDALAFAATGLPPGLAIDPVTGLISGAIDRSASQAGGGVYVTTVTASDGRGGSATTTITWTVANPAPVARDDAIGTRPDTPVTIPVVADDSDPDGDPLTVVAAGEGRGTVVINPDNSLAYTPAPGFIGIDTITYTINDGEGGTATAIVSVDVTQGNRPPVGTIVPPRGDVDGATVSLPLGGAFTDPDGDPLTFTATGLPPGLAIDPATGLVSGTITPGSVAGGPAGDGRFPVAVTARDPSGAITDITFVYTVGNAAPIANDDRASVQAGATVIIPVLANDSDPDGDRLTVTAAQAGNGAARINPDGTISYTPGPAFAGLDTITYTIGDGRGGTATATVTVGIVNAAPVAQPDTAATRPGAPVTIPVLANDSDADGDPLTVVDARAGSGAVRINPDGTITYTPGPGFTGTDTIAYTVSDGRGGTGTAIVTVAVAPVNGAPAVPGRDAAVPAIGGVPTVIDALAGVTDPDGDRLTIISASAGTGSVVIRPDGTLVFTAPLGFDGLTTISITVSDGRGGTATGIIPVRVADGRGADVEQLLRFGRPRLFDPTPGLATIRLTDGEARNPLIVTGAVDGIRTLDGTALGDRPVQDAVNGARALRGTQVDPDAPILREVARLQRLADFRDAGDRLFDHRWSDFTVRGLTGFSVTADSQAGVMVESVVRGHALYVEVRDMAGPDRAAISKVEIRPARGEANPGWLHVDPRGLAIIERGAEMDELHLVVRVTRTDGRVSTTPIVVQGETGLVTLDRPGAGAAPPARPLDATLSTPAASARAEAVRLSQLFQ